MKIFRGKRADRTANGMVLVLFAFLLLLKQLHIFNNWFWMQYVNQPATYFLLAGLTFIWIKRQKHLGYVLTAIAIIGYSNIMFGWANAITPHAFPIAILIIGVLIIFFPNF